MSEQPRPAGDAFAASRARFAELLRRLQDGEAAGYSFSELEDLLEASGGELVRQLLRDHLDLRTARAQEAAGPGASGSTARGGGTDE